MSHAGADNAVIPDTPEQLGLRGSIDSGLQLQVFLNGHDSQQIVAVTRDGNGRFLMRRSDLELVGIKASVGPAGAEIALDSLAGLKYSYDEDKQTLALQAPEALLAPRIYSASTLGATGVAPISADWGVALNYDIYASTAAWQFGQRLDFGTGSLTLDGRAFSPYGVFTQSGILGTTAFNQQTALRLDTTWRYDDDAHDSTYEAGDLINAGLPWTRPIRIGGFQVQRGFGLRPDLVTGPTATVSGSAAVPSSVDVFVNNFKIFSQNVDPGPYRIQGLPAVSGGGSATLVTHDVTGKESVTSVPFFVSSRLLAPGAVDYSVEAGFARLNYGVDSFDYNPRLVGSGSLRGGITDWLTVEGHLEGGDGLINGGAGVTIDAFQHAVVEASLAGSHYGAATAAQLGFGLSTNVFGAMLDISSQHAFNGYADLAEITAPPGQATTVLGSLLPYGPQAVDQALLLSTSVAPPRALDRVSLTFPRVLGKLSLNLSFLNQVEMNGSASRIASVGLTRNFRNGLSTFVTAFTDFANRNDYGAMAGLSFTFGKDISVSTQSGLQSGGFAQTTQIAKSAGQDVGDYGWSVDDQEGVNRYVQASAAYQTSVGRATAYVEQYGAGRSASTVGSADFTGSAAIAGGGVALAPHISDSFAMVDAGAPGVTVLEDNRVIGKTDASGRLLAPNLRSFEDNKIAIDPATLPLNAQSSTTELVLRPRAESGVVADFKVNTRAHDAEIILVDEAGRPLPPGASVLRQGRAPAIVGYDGRAYLTGLAAHNRVTVRTNGRDCVADFDYREPKRALRPTLGPLVCRASAS